MATLVATELPATHPPRPWNMNYDDWGLWGYCVEAWDVISTLQIVKTQG